MWEAQCNQPASLEGFNPTNFWCHWGWFVALGLPQYSEQATKSTNSKLSSELF